MSNIVSKSSIHLFVVAFYLKNFLCIPIKFDFIWKLDFFLNEQYDTMRSFFEESRKK